MKKFPFFLMWNSKQFFFYLENFPPPLAELVEPIFPPRLTYTVPLQMASSTVLSPPPPAGKQYKLFFIGRTLLHASVFS